MKILILGSWREDDAVTFAEQLTQLGALLVQHGHTPIIAPGGGVYGAVGQAYRAHGGNKSVGYYPSEQARAAVGEVYTFEPDVKVLTDQDYPTRNIRQTQEADAIIAVAGKLGTVTDFIAGATDYKIPCAYLKGSSRNMDMLMEFDGIKGQSNVYVGDTITSLVEFVENYKPE